LATSFSTSLRRVNIIEDIHPLQKTTLSPPQPGREPTWYLARLGTSPMNSATMTTVLPLLELVGELDRQIKASSNKHILSPKLKRTSMCLFDQGEEHILQLMQLRDKILGKSFPMKIGLPSENFTY
jgi:hypothetical protein